MEFDFHITVRAANLNCNPAAISMVIFLDYDKNVSVSWATSDHNKIKHMYAAIVDQSVFQSFDVDVDDYVTLYEQDLSVSIPVSECAAALAAAVAAIDQFAADRVAFAAANAEKMSYFYAGGAKKMKPALCTTMDVLFWTITNTITQAVTLLPLIALMYFGVRVYKITKSQYIDHAFKVLKDGSVISLNGRHPDGLFAGKWYVGYATKDTITLVSTRAAFIALTGYSEDIVVSPGVLPTSIRICARYGSYANTYFHTRSLAVDSFTPRPHQREVIDDILHIFNERQRATVLLHGRPGTGKSLLVVLLAKELQASLCMSFDPTVPGTEINALYNDVGATAAQPLIIVIEEVDIIFERIHSQKVVENINVPSRVRNKCDWNRFMDDFDIGLYPYTILLLTSNMSPTDIAAAYDPAYIRSGRISAVFEMKC